VINSIQQSHASIQRQILSILHNIAWHINVKLVTYHNQSNYTRLNLHQTPCDYLKVIHTLQTCWAIVSPSVWWLENCHLSNKGNSLVVVNSHLIILIWSIFYLFFPQCHTQSSHTHCNNVW